MARDSVKALVKEKMPRDLTVEEKVYTVFRHVCIERYASSASNWTMSDKVAAWSDVDGNLYLLYDGVWIARSLGLAKVLQMQDPQLLGADGAVLSLLQAVCAAFFLPPIYEEDGVWMVPPRSPDGEPHEFGSFSDDGLLEVFCL